MKLSELRLSEYEKRVVIPAIKKVYPRENALDVFETMQKAHGEHSWSFVLWKKDVVKKAANPLIRM